MKWRSMLLISLCIVFCLFGCQVQRPDATDTAPVLSGGALESPLLAVDESAYSRSVFTGGGRFLEIESGYYFLPNGYLYYADKSDLANWVLVCANPDCDHTDGSGCSAMIPTSAATIINDRIHFMTSLSDHRHLYPHVEDANGYLFCSSSLNGSDVKLVHVFEDGLLSGGSAMSTCIFPDGYLLCIARFHEDGSYTGELYYKDAQQQKKLLNIPIEDKLAAFSSTAQDQFGIFGDNAFTTALFDGTMDRWLLWLHNGEITKQDVSALPTSGSYLEGSVLRCYKTNDGYYDIDLLTGEETRLADTQIQNSNAMILLPNCIIESPLVGNPAVRNNQNPYNMSFFDGQSWHDVSLPDTLLSAPENVVLAPLGVTTDSVLFLTYQPDTGYIFYRMMLGATEYHLEYYATFNLR